METAARPEGVAASVPVPAMQRGVGDAAGDDYVAGGPRLEQGRTASGGEVAQLISDVGRKQDSELGEDEYDPNSPEYRQLIARARRRAQSRARRRARRIARSRYITVIVDPHGYTSKYAPSELERMFADGELIETVSPWYEVTLS